MTRVSEVRTTKRVKKVVEVDETVSEFSIVVSEDEAKVLAAVFMCIGGEPSGPRGVTQEILEQLRNKGIKEPEAGTMIDRTKGAIYFKHDSMELFLENYAPNRYYS